MEEIFGLLKELTSSTTPEKVLVREEIRNPTTKNVNAISLYRIENEKIKENNEVIDKNIIEQEKRSIEEPVRIANNRPLGEERKIIEPPQPQPVSHYLKHKINKELIEGLVENQRFNNYLLAMQLGKMECEDYYLLPKEPMRKVMLKKDNKKVDMGGKFIIPCNIGGLKYMDALVDQGSDVNIMPLFTYNRLTDEKLVEIDIRLSLSSQSHIYLLRIAEDVLVEIAGFVYPVDFVILDIKEDRKKPFNLGMPVPMTIRAKIKFDKGTIALKSSKSKVYFQKCPEFFCKFKERKKDKVDSSNIISKKAHLLGDKQILSVGVFDEVTWNTFRGNTRDLGSILGEVGQEYDFTPKEGLKNKSHMVKMASGKLVTPSGSASDRVRKSCDGV
ncbi:MAK10-like protein [Tanacetum coccineum]